MTPPEERTRQIDERQRQGAAHRPSRTGAERVARVTQQPHPAGNDGNQGRAKMPTMDGIIAKIKENKIDVDSNEPTMIPFFILEEFAKYFQQLINQTQTDTNEMLRQALNMTADKTEGLVAQLRDATLASSLEHVLAAIHKNASIMNGEFDKAIQAQRKIKNQTVIAVAFGWMATLTMVTTIVFTFILLR